MPINFLKGDRHTDVVLQPGAEWVGVFEPGVELEGRLNVAAGAVRLNAHFKGEISSEGTVVIGERGDVEAAIRAKVIVIAGKVTGNVHASERLEIKEHGVVLGDIHTPVLTVDPGGYFEGQCQMPVPQSANQASSKVDADPPAGPTNM